MKTYTIRLEKEGRFLDKGGISVDECRVECLICLFDSIVETHGRASLRGGSLTVGDRQPWDYQPGYHQPVIIKPE